MTRRDKKNLMYSVLLLVPALIFVLIFLIIPLFKTALLPGLISHRRKLLLDWSTINSSLLIQLSELLCVIQCF